MKSDKFLANENIMARRVLIVDDNGDRLGEFMLDDALNMASDKGLDLVQMNNSETPVCKFLDFGKLLYEDKKRQKKAKASIVKTKEIRLRITTEKRDIETLVGKAKKFLAQGNKVKITVKFRGREGSHPELIKEQCLKVYDQLADISQVDSEPKREGKDSYSMTVSPL